MNMGKKITELTESSSISGESSYAVAMGDGTGVKQVKHKNLVEQLLSDMELPYDKTLAMLMETETDEEGDQKIPNLQAISDWIMSKIVNNLLATEEGFFLDARIGRILDQRISANANAISQINSDLPKMYTSKNIFLNNLDWTKSAEGKYFAYTDLKIPEHKMIISFYICNWGLIKDTDIIQLTYGTQDRISIISNTNTFHKSAGIQVRIIYN